jgi:tetratricopeptide (TPR) repeat protein
LETFEPSASVHSCWSKAGGCDPDHLGAHFAQRTSISGIARFDRSGGTVTIGVEADVPPFEESSPSSHSRGGGTAISTIDYLLEISFSFACGAAREAYASGHYADAVAIGRAGLDLVAGELNAMRAQVLTTIADALRMLGRLGEAGEHAEKACSIARELLDRNDSVLRDALHAMAKACAELGDLIRAQNLAHEVLHLAQAGGQKETAEAHETLSLDE